MPAPKTIPLSSAIVYIAGIETPVAELAVQFGVGMVPSVTISVPACEELERLGSEDRVPVAVFYLDQWYSKDNSPPKPEYRLLFDGEITGWEYQRSAYGQMISFRCSAHISILETANARFFFGDLKELQPVNLTSSTTGIFSPGRPLDMTFLLNKGLFNDGDSIERPFDFIANILLAMKAGGSLDSNAIATKATDSIVEGEQRKSAEDAPIYKKEFIEALINSDNKQSISPDYFGQFNRKGNIISAIMAFFVMYTNRTKFDKRWIASSLERFIQADSLNSDFANIVDVTYEAIRKKTLTEFNKGVLQNIFGQGDSYYKMIMSFYQFAYYEILMLPTAQYVQTGRLWTDAATTDAGIPKETVTNSESKTEEFRLGNYISKPFTQFAIAPGCNILFPSLVTSIGFSESFTTQPTRTIASNQFIDLAIPEAASGSDGDPAISVARTVSYPINVLSQFTKPSKTPTENGAEKTEAEAGMENNFLSTMLFPEEYFKGPLTQYSTVPSWYQMLKETVSKVRDEIGKSMKEGQQKTLGKDRSNAPMRYVPNKDQIKFDENMSKAPDGAPPVINWDLLKKEAEEHNSTMSGDKFDSADVSRVFVRMLHHEGRYAQRGGSIEGPFNPYLIPAFPFVYLDDPLFNLHLTGHVAAVSHRISASTGWATSVSYTYGRTLKESYEEAINDHIASDGKTFYETAPQMPVSVVRDMTQTNEPSTVSNTLGAKNYYKNLFYNSCTNSRKEFSFDFKKYFLTTKSPVGDRQLPTSKEVTYKMLNGIRAPKDLEVKLEVKASEMPKFENYDEALKAVARPICTLDEYVTFIKGKKIGEIPVENYGIVVPVQIQTYDAYSDLYEAPSVVDGIQELFMKGNYTLRRDWVKRLKEYREKVRNRQFVVK